MGNDVATSAELLVAKQRMLRVDLRGRGIRDRRTLEAIARVPRERFVPAELQHEAYADNAMTIGSGQTISQPYMVALMTEALELTGSERVLEIGTGSGYQAAVLCEMGARVFTIERLRPLFERTSHLLKKLEYKALCRCGDGTKGWEAVSPFEGIVVTAGATVVPDELLQQLKIPEEGEEGSRLVIPVGDRTSQRMTRILRMGADTFQREETEGFRFVPLIGAS